MGRVVRLVFVIFLGLVVLLPALMLVLAVLVASVWLAGLPLAAAGGLLAAVAVAASVALGLAVLLLVAVWCAHFRVAVLHFDDHERKGTLRVHIDLTGRVMFAHTWAKIRGLRHHGLGLSAAIEQGVTTYLTVDVRDYLLAQVQEQHGVAVVDAMHLADETAYHFSL
ncbi:hypothetical protein [Lacticaseibacillus suihuaensis]